MTIERWWIALATFERDEDEHGILPEGAHGACGWMAAVAPDEDGARRLLIRDLRHHGLRVVEIDEMQEVFSDQEIKGMDDHLAKNVRTFEKGKRTTWGTLHCYEGEGEA